MKERAALRMGIGWVAAMAWVLGGASARADQAPWFDNDWPARRVVDASVSDAMQVGPEVAVATFYTGGMARPDAADVRVAVQGRRLVKHRILQVGPGDLVRVAFEALPALDRYYIYFGNPKAEKTEPLEIKRGVLLEVRHWGGGRQPARLDQLKRAWAKAEPLAADLVPNIAFGHNPLLDSRRPAILHFTGWFIPPRPGTYQVTTNSQGGSWIEIDGRQVVAWPGSHGPSRRARHVEEVALTQQRHRLDYWNVSHGGRTVAVAAFRTPGQKSKRFGEIPADVFLPMARADLVELDLRGEPFVADFFPEHAGETWWPDHYAVRIRFRNLSRGISDRHGGSFEWDFGDGQTADVSEPTHVYLASGDYAVTLRAKRGTRAHTFRTTVHVDRNWRTQTERKIDPASRYGEEVARYDLAALDLRNLRLAVDLFDHLTMREACIAAASELVFKRKGVKEPQVLDTGLMLGEHLRAAEQYQEAVRTYQRLEKRLKRRDRKAAVAVQIGETLLRDLHQYEAAEKDCRRVLQAYANGGAAVELRRAHIGLGDIWRHRGDAGKARQAYEAADRIKVKVLGPKREAVRIGALARYVEEYTREKDWEWVFQYLDDWAWEFPLAKLEGHWSWLRATALRAKGDVREALREALDLTGANPHSAYAVRLLMLAAECYVDQGDRRKARLTLQTAVEDYPEDPARDEARRRLQALGGPVETDAKPSP